MELALQEFELMLVVEVVAAAAMGRVAKSAAVEFPAEGGFGTILRSPDEASVVECRLAELDAGIFCASLS